MSDFNVETNDTTVKNFCQIYGCKNIVQDKTLKNPISPTGLSDFHKMSLS